MLNLIIGDNTSPKYDMDISFCDSILVRNIALRFIIHEYHDSYNKG